ncbi:SIMPL domain-containing protein [Bradyrhizobium sp.]|uniref:SIMPL domain-containing protein n=1 Tax=Bradyrhizobium sp. TaxID=376 RepID=UPI001EB2F197|nr:SIMPL domain-containing protein [Bradyrhizobium sp.]MBV9981793.1 SIMPL domain-containing protein [Bradyrhizobium sp.]
MNTSMRAAALSGLMLLAAAAPGLAQAQPGEGDAVFRATTLQLAAEGQARVVPDTATVELGVAQEAPTAAEAMRADAELMSRTIAAVRRAGVAEKDIRTSGVSLEPQYVYEQNQPPRLTGYKAANQVVIMVRDLPRAGAVIDAAVAAGANQVQGVSFGLADPGPAQDQARQAAVRALAAKAELYAQATGYRVLRLVSLSEGEAAPIAAPRVFVTAARAGKMAATPIAPGETTVQVEVTGVYELSR